MSYAFSVNAYDVAAISVKHRTLEGSGTRIVKLRLLDKEGHLAGEVTVFGEIITERSEPIAIRFEEVE